MTSGRSLLREREGKAAGKVAFVELFFDLVFVFSIIQLSHALAHHFTPAGIVETVILILAVWWVWIFTTWVTNWLDPERTAVRVMLFVLMFLGLILSTSIPEAFADKGLVFALAYVAMQVGRSLFTVWALRGRSPGNYRNFQRITVWLALAGVFWIAGGLAGHEMRLVLWIIALAIEYASPALGFFVPGLGRSTPADWDVSGEHMAERCALFIIICLGETILVSGRTFSGLPVDAVNLLAFASAFLTTVTMWWIYFRFGHHKASHLIETSDMPGGIARAAFTYAHIPLVTGIIVAAVGAEFMLSHPLDAAEAKHALAIIGGPVVYLVGNLLFKGAVYGRLPLSHMVGLALYAALWFATPAMNALALGAAAAAILVVIAAWEFRSLRGSADAHA